MSIPPNINTMAITNFRDTCSARKTTPPKAAIGGTRSCTIAAKVVVNFRNALY
jgi:hypothetical protein